MDEHIEGATGPMGYKHIVEGTITHRCTTIAASLEEAFTLKGVIVYCSSFANSYYTAGSFTIMEFMLFFSFFTYIVVIITNTH